MYEQACWYVIHGVFCFTMCTVYVLLCLFFSVPLEPVDEFHSKGRWQYSWMVIVATSCVWEMTDLHLLYGCKHISVDITSFGKLEGLWTTKYCILQRMPLHHQLSCPLGSRRAKSVILTFKCCTVYTAYLTKSKSFNNPAGKLVESCRLFFDKVYMHKPCENPTVHLLGKLKNVYLLFPAIVLFGPLFFVQKSYTFPYETLCTVN